MLGHRLRRFRLEETFSKVVSNRPIRTKSLFNIPFLTSIKPSISYNLIKTQCYSTSSYLSSRTKTATKPAKDYGEESSQPTPKDSGKSSADSNSSGTVSINFTPSADGAELLKYYPEYFSSSTAQSAYDVRTGTYLDVDEKDILRYFPEGLAGETSDEFQFTNKKRWMIRDSTKVLFRVIEETEKRLKYDTNAIVDKSKSTETASAAAGTTTLPKIEGVGLHTTFKSPRLQGQSEWASSQFRVTHYGQELFPSSGEVASTEFEGFVKTKGPGSPLEATIDALKTAVQANKSEIPDRVVITGGRGNGKSTVLNQAVMFARQRGWLVVFIPNGWEHVQAGPYIEPLKVKVDGVETTVYDNPYMNKVLLRGLWKAHHKQLKKLVIENTETLLKYQPLIQQVKKSMGQAITLPGRDKLSFVELRAIITEDEDHFEEYDTLDADVLKGYDFLKSKLVTVEDLILLGVAFADVSGWVVQDIIQELRQQSQIPVLFAIDQYNSWFAPSAFAYEEQGQLHAQQLNVPRALSFVDTKKHGGAGSQWTVKHGLCIATTSFRHPEAQHIRFDTDIVQSLPLRLRVNAYTQQEYLSAMSYYMQPGVSPLGAVCSWDDVYMFRMLTNSIPRLLRLDSLPFFLPKNVRGLEQELEMAALLGMSDASKTHKAEDFDVSLGYDNDEDTLDFDSFESQEGNKMDDRYFARDGTDVEVEEFFDVQQRSEADEFYSDIVEDEDDDDLGPKR